MQVKKQATELAEYKAESSTLRNQDLTVRKLEDKVRSLEAVLEEKDTQLDEVRLCGRVLALRASPARFS
jgi:homeobox protein cut-like